ncbi:glutathione S-transferase family protein [Limnobacter litoralis]|uniref:GST C-terminal domain-containing protein n=1 Tax=Limnobacter litoralis TaxID=481366 RepID=A0ABQ5YP35_9BURK|nr:glutathione S-transferase N-terminal domain-containing protein [Limnobacter litoralis]GLR25065.1 hypothetical protein GCM10007875_01520 [Limnobacter litoralis]
MARHTLYGWHMSYFTGKALCYLRYKKVDFDFRQVNYITLMKKIKAKTGAVVMPVIKTADGQWIQDTSVIIDRFESETPVNPVMPDTPLQQFASRLLEAWGDEWWIPSAMYTRWCHPENYVVFEHDAGKGLLPWAPWFIQKRVAAIPAKAMRSLLPWVGVIPEQYKALDDWNAQMMDALDAHFKQTPFLLGNRPSLGDFGLVGSMYGHHGRDPWPKRELLTPRKNLSAWLTRMTNPEQFSQGALWPADEMPPTLDPVFHSIFREFVPFVRKTADAVSLKFADFPVGKPLPRRVDMIEGNLAGKPFTRGGLVYMIWMVQRALDTFNSFSAEDQNTIRKWLKSWDAEDLVTKAWPRVERVALTVCLAERIESKKVAA